ncbi:Hsp20/alpha crystallin family protein [Fulvivirgaceae bacterium PWU4]|uniref:Hsp20/alpha crystallin family protein n=1 Tax=Chryseosolibacter histidini TaxID=2782349 RepID=A0AAP2DGM6_9BACT|nr:Hsp20/alpha crystallin family protein [Chryseosolibacter histidini]MBT1696016.1 Hsp20/alpha crystallin family protein [Chryseosolibacter histidini]
MHQYFNYGACPPGMKRHAHPLHERFSRMAYHRRPKYNVPVNILEKETHYEVHVYALGFDKAQIKVSVAHDVLYISGTRTIDEGDLPNFIQQEYPIRSFERMILLHGKVDTANISARHEEGILKITLQKTPDAHKNSQEIVVQ